MTVGGRWGGALCGRSYLAAGVHVEQAHPAGQLLGVLDAVPQDARGEIQGALIRLSTPRENSDKKAQKLKHKDINLPARGANRHFCRL